MAPASSPSIAESSGSGERPQFCDACFTGDYPTALTDQSGGSVPAQLSLLAETA